MILSSVSNKGMKGKVARGGKQGAQGRETETYRLSSLSNPGENWGVLMQMEDGLIFLKLSGSNEALIHSFNSL